MPIVSISKAIKLAGVSRQHFYDAYISTGKISVDRSDPKRPVIDTSEILRVFGRLSIDNIKKDSLEDRILPLETESIRLEIERLKAENAGLKSLVQEKGIRIEEKDRELERQRERITSLEMRYDRLLEDKSEKKPESAGIWNKLKSIFSG